MSGNFYVETPQGLLEKILMRIRKEERFLVFKKTILFSIIFIGSLGAFLPSLNILLSDINKSGFISFFSLIFSDFSSVAIYWRSFSMILLETLPAASLVLFLVVLFTFLESLKYLVKNIKIISGKNQLAAA